MGIEFELKYRADRQTQALLRREFPGDEAVYQMESTYYDTAAGDFSRQRCTLRRRYENGRSICTLKTPAAGHGRNEWEVECDTIEAAVSELCKLGIPEDLLSPAKAGLVPICGARFTRIAKTLELPDCTVELALDSGILMGGSRECPLEEAEIELKVGSEAVCAAFATKLAEIYGLVPEEKSKFLRALELAKGE